MERRERLITPLWNERLSPLSKASLMRNQLGRLESNLAFFAQVVKDLEYSMLADPVSGWHTVRIEQRDEMLLKMKEITKNIDYIRRTYM